MSIRVNIGSFTQPAITGSQQITGLGFKPSLIMFFGNRLTADGEGAHATFCTGMVSAGLARRAYGGDCYDGIVGTTKSYSWSSADGVFQLIDANTATLLAKVDVTSLDSDGFTINWTTSDGVARIISYVAIAGTDILNSGFAGVREVGTAGTSTFAHAWGFAPDVVIHFSTRNTNAFPPASGAASWLPRFGFWNRLSAAPHEQGALANNFQNASTTYNNSRWMRNDRTNGVISANSLLRDTTYDAIDSSNITSTNQFQTSTTILDGADFGIRGVKAKVGSFSCATVAGNQTITGLGFEPVLVIIMSSQATRQTTNAVTLDSYMSFGCGNPSNSFVRWVGGKNGGESGASKTQQALNRNKIIRFYSVGGTSPTLLASAGISKLTSDGFILNWDTVDGVARDAIYLAIGQKRGSRGLAHAGF